MKRVLLVTAMLILMSSVCSAEILRVSWNANPEPDLAGYKVYWKATSATTWNMNDVGNVLTVDIVAGILPNVEYCAQVSAYDDSGNESVKSDASCSILDTIPPTKPSGVKVLILKIIAWLHHLWG